MSLGEKQAEMSIFSGYLSYCFMLCVIKRTAGVLLLWVLAQPATAESAKWEVVGIGNDVFRAHYTFGSGRLSVHCGYQRFFEIRLLRQGLNGDVTFVFDDKRKETLRFARGGFSAGRSRGKRGEQKLNGSSNEKTYYRVLSLLRSSKTLQVKGFNFKSGLIPLEGAKEILAFCRETDPITMLPQRGIWGGLKRQ